MLVSPFFLSMTMRTKEMLPRIHVSRESKTILASWTGENSMQAICHLSLLFDNFRLATGFQVVAISEVTGSIPGRVNVEIVTFNIVSGVCL